MFLAAESVLCVLVILVDVSVWSEMLSFWSIFNKLSITFHQRCMSTNSTHFFLFTRNKNNFLEQKSQVQPIILRVVMGTLS